MSKSYHSCDPSQVVVQLDQFRERLPRKPYHTDHLGCGLGIAPAAKALLSRYIQPNGPTHKHWLIYDVDRPGAAMDWYDLGAPPPTLTVMTPDERSHAHLLYLLETPIRTAPDGRPGPLRYAAAIDCALSELLDADPGYSGLITKNPAHEHWQVRCWEPEPYTLELLHGFLDVQPWAERRRERASVDRGLGRNCSLFDDLRRWAYKAIRQGWPDYRQWQAACLDRAFGYNSQFAAPLDLSEAKHVAKSVARWTHKHLDAASFSAWQAAQGRKGGSAKGKALRDQLLPTVADLWSQGVSKADIARELGQSKATIGNWVKRLEGE